MSGYTIPDLDETKWRILLDRLCDSLQPGDVVTVATEMQRDVFAERFRSLRLGGIEVRLAGAPEPAPAARRNEPHQRGRHDPEALYAAGDVVEAGWSGAERVLYLCLEPHRGVNPHLPGVAGFEKRRGIWARLSPWETAILDEFWSSLRLPAGERPGDLLDGQPPAPKIEVSIHWYDARGLPATEPGRCPDPDAVHEYLNRPRYRLDVRVRAPSFDLDGRTHWREVPSEVALGFYGPSPLAPMVPFLLRERRAEEWEIASFSADLFPVDQRERALAEFERELERMPVGEVTILSAFEPRCLYAEKSGDPEALRVCPCRNCERARLRFPELAAPPGAPDAP